MLRIFSKNEDLSFNDYIKYKKGKTILTNLKTNNNNNNNNNNKIISYLSYNDFLTITQTFYKFSNLKKNYKPPQKIIDLKTSFIFYNKMLNHIQHCESCNVNTNNNNFINCKEIKNILYPYGENFTYEIYAKMASVDLDYWCNKKCVQNIYCENPSVNSTHENPSNDLNKYYFSETSSNSDIHTNNSNSSISSCSSFFYHNSSNNSSNGSSIFFSNNSSNGSSNNSMIDCSNNSFNKFGSSNDSINDCINNYSNVFSNDSNNYSNCSLNNSNDSINDCSNDCSNDSINDCSNDCSNDSINDCSSISSNDIQNTYHKYQIKKSQENQNSIHLNNLSTPLKTIYIKNEPKSTNIIINNSKFRETNNRIEFTSNSQYINNIFNLFIAELTNSKAYAFCEKNAKNEIINEHKNYNIYNFIPIYIDFEEFKNIFFNSNSKYFNITDIISDKIKLSNQYYENINNDVESFILSNSIKKIYIEKNNYNEMDANKLIEIEKETNEVFSLYDFNYITNSLNLDEIIQIINKNNIDISSEIKFKIKVYYISKITDIPCIMYFNYVIQNIH
jgi:hypothetical protein